MNSLLMQQIQLQKQLIDQVVKNTNVLERVLSANTSPILETPVSISAVSQDDHILNHSLGRGKVDSKAESTILPSSSSHRLTFTKSSGLINEEIPNESNLFEDFII